MSLNSYLSVLATFDSIITDGYMDIAEREGFADTIHPSSSVTEVEQKAINTFFTLKMVQRMKRT